MMQTLLVVEDDAVLHDALEGVLRDEGYEVICVSSVAEALHAIEGFLVDGALLDFMLRDGTCEPLLAELVTRGVPVVIVSAHTEARALGESLAVPCVHKPFVVEQLLGILSGTIQRRSLRRTVVSRVG
jgi:DNA-binding response OmpR family regulator